MKKLLLSLAAICFVASAGVAIAGGNELAYFKIPELVELDSGDIASGDFVVVYDASATKVRKVDATDFPYGGGAITLDDGSGASPALTFTDETDETAAFVKADSGFLALTTEAADGLNVLVGNIKVGNGTPGTAQDGEDLYVEGGLEVDGTARLDGAVNVAGVTTLSGKAILTGPVNLGTVATFTDSDATPDVTASGYWKTNTSAVTITDFDGTGIADGDVIVVVSKGAITYDVTSSGIKGGTTDIITASGDVTTFVYDGTDWLVVARMDMSDDLN